MEKRKFMPDSLFLALSTILVLGCFVDFDIHQNQGLSVEEIRHFYEQYLGDIANHIGNFGFAAAAAIVLTTAYKFASRRDLDFDESSLLDCVVHHGYLVASGLLLATIAASELANGNTGVWGDILASGVGIGVGTAVTSEELHRLRIGRQRQVVKNLDRLFDPDPKPSFLHCVGTSADQIFI